MEIIREKISRHRSPDRCETTWTSYMHKRQDYDRNKIEDNEIIYYDEFIRENYDYLFSKQLLSFNT